MESISLVPRDTAPNPCVKEHYPGVYMVMGETAEVVAKRYGISRDAQDEYAARRASSVRRVRSRMDSSPARSRRCGARAVLDKKTGEIGEEERRRSRRVQPARHDARGTGEAAAGVRHDQRPRQRHGRQLVAARPMARRRRWSCRATRRKRSASRRCWSSAATRWPAASRTRWASGRCSPCRSCSSTPA